jgi:hypothetical protein
MKIRKLRPSICCHSITITQVTSFITQNAGNTMTWWYYHGMAVLPWSGMITMEYQYYYGNAVLPWNGSKLPWNSRNLPQQNVSGMAVTYHSKIS